MREIQNTFEQLTTRDISELGKAWKRHYDELQAADKITQSDDQVLLYIDNKPTIVQLSRPEIAMALFAICKNKMYEFKQTISDTEWKEMKARARRFERDYISEKTKPLNRARFDELIQSGAAQPVLSAINWQWPYQIQVNADGTYSIALFGVPLPACESIESEVLADYLLSLIFRDQFRSEFHWSGPEPEDLDV